ncbi:MAG TPA: hypothetical protein VIK86_04965 [Candidatus Paceibacterota bacterium]
MENKLIIINKKSSYVWIVLTLIILGIISYIFTVILGIMNIHIFLEHYIFTISVSSVLSLIFNFINLYILVVYFYKLYNLKDDVIKWTNLFFYFFIFSSSFGLVFNYLMFLPVVVTPWVILMVIVALIWVTFTHYLKRIRKVKLENTSVIFNNNKEENIEVIKERLSFISWVKNNKTILIIIFVILVLIFGPTLFMGTKARIECGRNAKLISNGNGGYYCSYYFINQPENAQCIDAKQFCELKGNSDKSDFCGFSSAYGKNVIRVKKDGVIYLQDGPVACNYCCGDIDKVAPLVKEVNTSKYDPNGPYPSPIVDSVNMINARGEVVDKWINGTFKKIGEDKTFEYREKISSNYKSAIDSCVKTNCKKVYFVDDTYIKYGAGAYSNDTDNPAIGKIIKVEFYSKGKKVVSYPNPHDISDSATYTILYSQNSKSGQTITYSEDLCMGVKGGGQYCYEPHYNIGVVAIFLNPENKSSLTASEDSSSIFFTGKIEEAELVSYQYSLIPDTGEIFPVVNR